MEDKREGRKASPYVSKIPELHRPTEGSLNRPETYEEKRYCWFYWIEAILNPALTRKVLDEVDYLPEFSAPWGSEWHKGEYLVVKRYG